MGAASDDQANKQNRARNSNGSARKSPSPSRASTSRASPSRDSTSRASTSRASSSSSNNNNRNNNNTNSSKKWSVSEQNQQSGSTKKTQVVVRETRQTNWRDAQLVICKTRQYSSKVSSTQTEEPQTEPVKAVRKSVAELLVEETRRASHARKQGQLEKTQESSAIEEGGIDGVSGLERGIEKTQESGKEGRMDQAKSGAELPGIEPVRASKEVSSGSIKFQLEKTDDRRDQPPPPDEEALYSKELTQIHAAAEFSRKSASDREFEEAQQSGRKDQVMSEAQLAQQSARRDQARSQAQLGQQLPSETDHVRRELPAIGDLPAPSQFSSDEAGKSSECDSKAELPVDEAKLFGKVDHTGQSSRPAEISEKSAAEHRIEESQQPSRTGLAGQAQPEAEPRGKSGAQHSVEEAQQLSRTGLTSQVQSPVGQPVHGSSELDERRGQTQVTPQSIGPGIDPGEEEHHVKEVSQASTSGRRDETPQPTGQTVGPSAVSSRSGIDPESQAVMGKTPPETAQISRHSALGSRSSVYEDASRCSRLDEFSQLVQPAEQGAKGGEAHQMGQTQQLSGSGQKGQSPSQTKLKQESDQAVDSKQAQLQASSKIKKEPQDESVKQSSKTSAQSYDQKPQTQSQSQLEENRQAKSDTKGDGQVQVKQEPTESRVGETPSRGRETPSPVGETPSRVTEASSRVGETPRPAGEGPSRVTETPNRVGETPSQAEDNASRSQGGQAASVSEALGSVANNVTAGVKYFTYGIFSDIWLGFIDYAKRG